MAQGQALTLFVRLFEATGKAEYRIASDGVFASFRFAQGGPEPWTVRLLGSNLWLEEYAGPVTDGTFNGHMFAAFGLWEYWRLTKSGTARLLLQGALASVKDRAPELRVSGWRSHYCLEHQEDAGRYHFTHIHQLHKLYV